MNNIMEKEYKFKVFVKCMTFNQVSFIKDAMDGFCMQQTNFPFVCCIVDDASTDGEQEVIKRYLEDNFKRSTDMLSYGGETEDYISLFLQHKTNKNCFFAVYLLKYNHWGKKSKYEYYNKWVCSSEYVAICEGDDYWINEQKLQEQVDFMDQHAKCSLCCHNAYIENSETKNRIGQHKIYKRSQYADRLHVLRDGGFLPTVSLLYRNGVFGDDYEKFPLNRAAGDIRIQAYAAIVGSVYYINKPMAVYRLNPDSVTHKAMNDPSLGIKRQNMHLDWYRRVDEYTQKKYHSDIDKSIAFCEARIIRLEGKYYKLWNPRYWPYLSNQRVTTKIGLCAAMFGLLFIPQIGIKMKR